MSSTQELNALPTTHRMDALTNWANQAETLDRYTEKHVHLLSFLFVGLGIPRINISILKKRSILNRMVADFCNFAFFLLAKVKGQ